MRVAIIGAGLAGTALGYVLKKAGLSPVIYEASVDIATGASGNSLGMVNPRLSAFRTPESEFYSAAFVSAIKKFDQIAAQIDWMRCGALHLITDEKKKKRFSQTLENWAWSENHMRILNVQQASEVAAIDMQHDALYLPDSGHLNPRKLCLYYAQGLDIQTSCKIECIKDLEEDIVILAGGVQIKEFEESAFLPLSTVRGQITKVKSNDRLKNLRCNIHYGGYCSAHHDGTHMLGATFQRWLDHTDLRDEDDQDNIEKLKSMMPNLKDDFEILESRASLRTASKDHFPIIGHLKDKIYVSTGHGSHGIVSSLAGAYLLADMVLGQPWSQSKFTVNALSPDRFTK